ncbi:MAG: hypothetical protein ACI9VR_002208 [Cognaticolwellia sp.]|jgi:hypothetical protein
MSAPPLIDAIAIQAHLHRMAERLRGSVLSMGTTQVFGQLGYPNSELGQQSFQVDPNVLPLIKEPREGQTLQVRYETSSAGYSFMTTYLGPYCDGLWRLAIPKNVDCLWERRHQRLKVQALFRPSHHSARYQQVNEVSEGGFSILMGPKSALTVDMQIQGILSVRQLLPITVFAKVRRIEGGKEGQIAGCSFEDIDSSDRAQIQALIRSLLG